VRKWLSLALVLSCAASLASAQPTVREKIAGYFQGWYAHIPGSQILVKPAREVVLPGLETYRVERQSSSKTHQEINLALYDAARGEVFVGDVFHDPDRSRADRPLDPGRDLPNIETSLRELFGLPVKVVLSPVPRGALTPLTVAIREDKDGDAFATQAGFVSNDGSTLMLGEFHSIAESPAAFRERVLRERPGIATERGRFTVTEFLDFQCERCRVRTPDVRRAVEARGGAVEVRFLPLVKVHDWAFAAAECAAALAGVNTALYRRYEETVFARAEGMSAAAARELASDIADAAGASAAFQAELSSGQARNRVLGDIGLGLRLGIHGPPAFVLDGRLVPVERGFLENALFLLRGKPSAPAPTAVPRGSGGP
jgi:Thioredoxin